MRNVDLDYLKLCLIKLNLNRFKKKSAQPLITQNLVHTQQIPLPPLPIQQKIAQILKAVDDKIEAEEKKKEALQAFFKTILHHLMTGKIRVKPLDF